MTDEPLVEQCEKFRKVLLIYAAAENWQVCDNDVDPTACRDWILPGDGYSLAREALK